MGYYTHISLHHQLHAYLTTLDTTHCVQCSQSCDYNEERTWSQRYPGVSQVHNIPASTHTHTHARHMQHEWRRVAVSRWRHASNRLSERDLRSTRAGDLNGRSVTNRAKTKTERAVSCRMDKPSPRALAPNTYLHSGGKRKTWFNLNLRFS